MRLLQGTCVGLAIVMCGACGDNPTPTAPSPPPTASVAAITVTGGGSTGAPVQLTAMAQFSDGTGKDVTTLAAWSSSDAQIASVTGGLVTVVAGGEVDVRATYQDVSGVIRLLVAPPPVTSLAISGATSADRFQLTATARLSDGGSQNVTNLAEWTSSNPQIASVSATGFVTVVATGETEVRAVYRGISTSQRLTVTASTLFTLTGTVREVAPNIRPLAGASVRAFGSSVGAVTTGANGTFTFSAMPAGRVLIEAFMAGYNVTEIDVTIGRDTQVSIDLYPTPPRDVAGATATARCQDGSWSWALTTAAACTVNAGVAYTVCPGVLCGL